MKKFSLMVILLLVGVSLSVAITEEEVKSFQGSSLFGPIGVLFGNEQINVHLLNSNGEEIVYGIITKDKVIQNIIVGGLEKPSLKVYVNEATVEEIKSADSPAPLLRKALKEKKISYKAVGFSKKVKFAFLSVYSNVVAVFGSKDKTVSDAELFAELRSLSNEELDVLVEGKAEKAGALAGQAYQRTLSDKPVIKKAVKVDKKVLAIAAIQIKKEQSHGVCGNGKVEAKEECDGTIYNKSCGTLGFAGGKLQCTECKLDTSKCGEPKICEPDKYYCADSNGDFVEGKPFRVRCNKIGTEYGVPISCIDNFNRLCFTKNDTAKCIVTEEGIPIEESKPQEGIPIEESKPQEGIPIEESKPQEKILISKETCGKFSEPGKYGVKPCDEFVGPLGVNFRVNEIDKYDQVRGDYVDAFGNVLLDDGVFNPNLKDNVAYYGLKLYSISKGVMVLTDIPKDVCSPYFFPCSIFLPNDALEGDVLVIENGYFGKTNDPQYPQLATCAAKNLANAAVHSSQFLGLPQPEKGLSQMFIFLDKKPEWTGTSSGPISIWYYQKGDPKINYEVSQCEKTIQSGNFAKGDHEITHSLIRWLGVPLTFNEGLGNYVPKVLEDKKPQGWETKGEIWDHPESACKENGFKKGYSTLPYIKHYDAKPGNYDVYVSGECFWQKLVYNYGKEVIPKVMGVLKQNVGKNKSFEESLKEAGVDVTKYKQWGLGE